MILEDAQSLLAPSGTASCAGDDDCAERIHDTAARMAEMVQNLLDANRIERGEMQLNLAPTDLGPALNPVVETQRPRATAKQQTIHLESEADAGRGPGGSRVSSCRCWRIWFPMR